ncbi:NFACT family protein [Candidatus Woesearchaeota archaeon]|nr:NFACT family protein [Candidatus Woesearchaeota archaeon]
MKQEISSLELKHIVSDLQSLVGGKIDKVYQPTRDELLLIVHVSGKGRLMLRIVPGKWLYLTTIKPANPEKPFGYCLYLRRRLKNARVVSIDQLESERIVDIHLQVKEKDKEFKYHLFVELFMKGNVILTDLDGVILSPMENQVWKDRTIKPKEQYKHPKLAADLFIISKPSFASLLKESKKGQLVKCLATDLGLGGMYAEELCTAASVEKQASADSLTDKEISALYHALVALRERKPSPCIIRQDGAVQDVVPFPLQCYQGLESAAAASYSEALDRVLSEMRPRQKDEAQKKRETAEEKTNKIVAMQSRQAEKLDKEAKECQRKGELIYENYQALSRLLGDLRKAKQQYSWEQMKSMLKPHALVKGVDSVRKKVIVELSGTKEGGENG